MNFGSIVGFEKLILFDIKGESLRRQCRTQIGYHDRSSIQALLTLFLQIFKPSFKRDSFKDWEKKLGYLCKFKGFLTPEQMKTDLEFVRAGDDEPYREHVYVWKF